MRSTHKWQITLHLLNWFVIASNSDLPACSLEDVAANMASSLVLASMRKDGSTAYTSSITEACCLYIFNVRAF